MNKAQQLSQLAKNLKSKSVNEDSNEPINELDMTNRMRICNLTIDALAKFRNAKNLGTKLNYLAELLALNTAATLQKEMSVTTLIGQAIATGKPYTGKL